MNYTIARCNACNSVMHATVVQEPTFRVAHSWCPVCEPHPRDEGRLIRAAGDAMRAQRLKGIAKYNSTLEDQKGYTISGMIDMTAEELADGSVYVQKVREMYRSLLDELEGVLTAPNYSERARIVEAMHVINRERGNV